MAKKRAAKRIKEPKKRPKKRVKKPSQAELTRRAKRGWVTRRKNQISRNTTLLRNVSRNIPEEKRLKVKPKRITKKQLSAQLKQAKELLAQQEEEIARAKEILRIDALTASWVDAVEPEFLHANGTLALYPSRAREQFLGIVSQQIWDQLHEAIQIGDFEFDRRCYEVADVLNLPVREIYTLYYSP